jgi:hypothetical protein
MGAVKRIILPSAVIALSIAQSATESLTQPLTDILLSQICERTDIKGKNCLRAKRYRHGEQCNVDLNGQVIEGRFLSSSSTTVLAGYGSDCEPRATKFGGTIVFERQNSAYAFKGYQPGLSIDECVTIAQSGVQDRLFCASSSSGQGHVSTSIGEVKFSLDFQKDVTTSFDSLIGAEESSAAYGAHAVECKKRFAWVDVSKPRRGPAPGSILLNASFVDGAAIRLACGRNDPRIKGAIGTPPPGYAFVHERNVKKGRFIIDLATRQIHTEAKFLSMQSR